MSHSWMKVQSWSKAVGTVFCDYHLTDISSMKQPKKWYRLANMHPLPSPVRYWCLRRNCSAVRFLNLTILSQQTNTEKGRGREQIANRPNPFVQDCSSRLACEYSCLMWGATWLSQKKRLWFSPKTFILMSICPEFRYHFRTAMTSPLLV